MQDVTPWPSNFDVSQPVARVLVDGREVDVESVTVSSELDSAMPELAATAGGGVVAATGTAIVLPHQVVTEQGANPWGNASVLVDASEIVVEAGYRDPVSGEVGCARQITGQVESLRGGALSSGADLEFVDYTPSLDRDITIEPLLAYYPPLHDSAPTRGAALSPRYITDRVLRHCGFYSTPPMVAHAFVSAPLMGSAVPERGTLYGAQEHTSAAYNAIFRPTSWGMGLANGALRYRPSLVGWGHGQLTHTLHVSFMRSAPVSGASNNSLIQLEWGSQDNGIRVQALWNGGVSVRHVQGGSSTLVVNMPAAEADGAEVFTVLVTPEGQATIYASNGATATGTATLPPLTKSTNMSEVYVQVPDSSYRLGGLQVALSEDQFHTFEPNAHLDPPIFQYSLDAFPFQDKVNCLDLLKDQASAELSAIWVDEYGHFQLRNRQLLRARSTVGTLTSTHNLLDLQWEIPVRSVFSRVEIEHDVPTVTIRREPRITVSDSSGSTLDNGDVEHKFFEPPANQDWHQVYAPLWMGASPDLWALRRGRGSYHGGIVIDEDNNEKLAYSTNLTQTWDQIGPQKWLLSSEANGLANDESIEQTHLDRPGLYGRFADEGLPIIRARGLVEWDSDTATGSARGPERAPVFTHQVGPWMQNDAELAEYADSLAENLTEPGVILKDVPIVPDPRIQLGDTFWLEDTSAYQVRLKVVIMGKTLSYQASSSGHDMTQTIQCQIIEAHRRFSNYGDLELVWDGRDYEALEDAWVGQNYDALEANPLDRS